MTQEQQFKVYEVFEQMTCEEVIRCLTNFMGMQIIDDELAQYLVDEGLATEDEVGIESDEDED